MTFARLFLICIQFSKQCLDFKLDSFHLYENKFGPVSEYLI